MNREFANTEEKTMTKLHKSTMAVAVAMASVLALPSHALEQLSDDEMSQTTGKELLNFTTIGTNEMGNPNDKVGFYRLMLDAKIELNSNINKLRLGCDDPSGDGPCDISIDKLALSGIVPKSGGTNQSYAGVADANLKTRLDYAKSIDRAFINPKDAGAGTDFVMDKPFIELAIKKPNSLVDRKLVGYRFGAYENWGIMSTGKAPPLNADGSTNVPIYGPVTYGSTQLKNYGTGEPALDALWAVMSQGLPNGLANLNPAVNQQTAQARKARFKEYSDYVNASIERGHSGVNYISGRLPVRLNNLNVNASVFDVWKGGIIQLLNGNQFLKVSAQTAIVSGRLSRNDGTDFGRLRKAQTGDTDPALVPDSNDFIKGYLRNVYLGDADTLYDPSKYGNYVANTALQGRANEFKRGGRALLENMIVNVHSLKPKLWLLPPGTNADAILGKDTGDRLNTQSISAKTFHQLQYGNDLNGNGKYDPGEGSKHQAFSYQTLDGLQWITTDKRFGSQYDKLGNVVKGTEKPINGGGYDWLSTRAGWWLESPLATVSEGYVPLGQTTTQGTPKLDKPIILQSLDLGMRPVDNCYGNLTFC